ncbi:acid phosphatase type 7 [Galendromus occidentalis]|uniref:Purple acid phosphatase n=1 Tax=Galendromus occidentalis TaxID=34638 RepID=A0AAJ6QQA8_9ACAR|nr:acid phosphatase type 7 [Galendromus occidentalis]
MFSRKMWMPGLCLLLSVSATVAALTDYDDEDYPQPEQIHLSLGADETQMIVTWVTQAPTNHSVVEYGLSGGSGLKFTRRASGYSTLYQDFGSERRKLYIHRAVLKKLIPGAMYYYHCGDPLDGWSAVYWFRALPNDANFKPSFLIYGDMGNKNGRAIALLQSEVQNGKADIVLHVGDLAYDMADDNGRRGDEFMRQIEPIAAYVPYQVCPGNHEYHYNFSNYDARFSMYNRQRKAINNHYHSFNVGPVHIVSISAEFYFFLHFGFEQIKYQFDWLVQDLTEANEQENREKRPWIFLMAHRPMYCTNLGNGDCDRINSIIRTGMPFTNNFALEPLLKKFGVDIMWTGHQHSYERLWPVFNATVQNNKSEPYSNPDAPIHIVTGSPGCEENLSPFGDDPLNVSAFRSSDVYTFSRLSVVRKTQLLFQQVAVPEGRVLDEIVIVKDTAYPTWQDPDMALDASVVQ